MKLNKSIKILAFDTAANACSAALWVDGGVVAARHQAMARGQAEALAPMIADVFEEARATGGGLEELDAIAVTVGPGTFAGVRIGLAMARALALPRRLPVVGLTTIDAIRWQAPEADELMLVAIETKREDFYVQLFGPGGEAVTAPSASMADEIMACLPAAPVVLVGDGAERLQNLLIAGGHKVSRCLGAVVPVARDFAGLAAERFCAGSIMGAEPLYLRPPSVTPPKAR